MSYRDVAGQSGYLYRQFADGKIQILQGQCPSIGCVLTSGSQWQAITNEIGPYKGPPPSPPSYYSQQGAGSFQLQTDRQAASRQGIGAAIGAGIKGLFSGRSAAAAPAPQQAPNYTPLYVLGGVAVVGLVGLLIYRLRNQD